MLSHQAEQAVLHLKHSSDVCFIAKICVAPSDKHSTGSTTVTSCHKTHFHVLFCLGVHERFFKYLMVDWKPSEFYYWTLPISHRHLLKDLCWSRQKKCQCDLKMWSECFRTVQRIWWSGSPKVLSSFFFVVFSDFLSWSGLLPSLILSELFPASF